MMLLDMALLLLVGFALGWLACFWQHKRQDDDLLRQMTRWRESSGGWVHSLPGTPVEAQKSRRVRADSAAPSSAGEVVHPENPVEAGFEQMHQTLLSSLKRERQVADRLGYRKR